MDFCVVYLDISGYFDKVWHNLLLKTKINRHCGLKLEVLRWLESYLHNRTHSVVVSNSISKVQIINAGCPQGSVLGPLLALSYVNDLAKLTEKIYFFFADDPILFKPHAHNSVDAQTSLRGDLEHIAEFGNKWGITFNSSKAVQQTFTYKHVQNPPSLMFDKEVIPFVTNNKHLYINISSDLTFHMHVKRLLETQTQPWDHFIR